MNAIRETISDRTPTTRPETARPRPFSLRRDIWTSATTAKTSASGHRQNREVTSAAIAKPLVRVGAAG